MPQRKRDSSTAAVDMKIAKSPDRAKRQRVSLACDACRAAREKCDGDRPQCGACTSVKRSCSYTPALKKRGIKTGYLRAIELSLTWIFSRAPEAEEALHRLFTESDGNAAEQLFVSRGKSSNRLYKQWTKSRIYKDVDRILSEDRPSRVDTSTDSSDFELSPADTGQGLGDVAGGITSVPPVPDRDARASPRPTRIQTAATASCIRYPRLPSSWRRLVDIYFTYTHCWLPVVHREEVYFAAMIYTSDGLQISADSDPYAIACHAQLWAILALASFQDGNSGTSPQNEFSSPQEVCDFARSLIPNDDANHERPMVCTMLLHSLVLMGKGKSMASWLIVGRAARLVLLTEQDLGGTRGINSRVLAKSPTLAACCVLDTLLSICLGKPTQLAFHVDSSSQPALFALYPEAPEPWQPLPGFGSVSKIQPATSCPSLTLYQLVAFSLLTGERSLSAQNLHGREQRTNNDGLVQSLHPQLQFCSSLNVGVSMPHLPSAMLLQVAFLASSILVSGYRASLLFTLLEIVELSIEYFGDRGTPAVLAYFMESIEKQIDFEDMRPSDRTKWSHLLKQLRSPWQDSQSTDSSSSHEPGIRDASQLGPFSQSLVGSFADSMEEHSRRQHISAGGQDSYPDPYAAYDFPVQSTGTGQSPSLHTPSVGLQASPHPDLSAKAACPPIDYDAMLDELGSIDYTDNIELDAQFMANLGFAPGCKTPESVCDLAR